MRAGSKTSMITGKPTAIVKPCNTTVESELKSKINDDATNVTFGTLADKEGKKDIKENIEAIWTENDVKKEKLNANFETLTESPKPQHKDINSSLLNLTNEQEGSLLMDVTQSGQPVDLTIVQDATGKWATF